MVFLLLFQGEGCKRGVLTMIVSQKMVAEAEAMYQQSIPALDVKYHLFVTQEHSVKVEVSPTANAVPIFSQVRVSPESISGETSRFESVCFLSWIFFFGNFLVFL